MNKAPEEMKINDALDLFEENGAKIAFFNGRCNVDEQFGKVMRKKLFSLVAVFAYFGDFILSIVFGAINSFC